MIRNGEGQGAQRPTFAFVIFDGVIGGAERMSVALAKEMQARGIKSTVVILGRADELAPYLAEQSVPFTEVGLRPGSRVLRHVRRFAKAVDDTGATVAVLDSFGYQGAALRTGGFRGTIVGVEHGVLANLALHARHKRLVRRVDRTLGLWGNDAEVAVSRFMLRLARHTVHHHRLALIPNGVSVRPPLPFPRRTTGRIRIGYMGRLTTGKGVEVLLEAMAIMKKSLTAEAPTLSIAGDGPSRSSLEQLTCALGLESHVRFLGWSDAVRFWREQHLAIIPSDTGRESFGLTALEAMMLGRAVIVTDQGALPELVDDGISGTVVRGGDPTGLAEGIMQYASHPEMLALHAAAARSKAEHDYTIESCADRYIRLVAALAHRRFSATEWLGRQC